jgi:predicted PurR-regulated permease PerM
MQSRSPSSLLVYLLLGAAVVFLVAILLNWIYVGMVKPIQMALFIGFFLAFIFWVLYERSRRGGK